MVSGCCDCRLFPSLYFLISKCKTLSRYSFHNKEIDYFKLSEIVTTENIWDATKFYLKANL